MTSGAVKEVFAPESGARVNYYRINPTARMGIDSGMSIANDATVIMYASLTDLWKMSDYGWGNKHPFNHLDSRAVRKRIKDKTIEFTTTLQKAYFLYPDYKDEPTSVLRLISSDNARKYLNGERDYGFDDISIDKELELVRKIKRDYDKTIKVGRRKVSRGISGSEYDFTSRYSGRFDTAWRTRKTVTRKGNKKIKNVHIFKGINCNMGDRHLLPIQAAIFAKVIEVLESKGYSIKVSVGGSTIRGVEALDGQHLTMVLIKDYTDRIDLRKLYLANHCLTFMVALFGARTVSQIHDARLLHISNQYIHGLGIANSIITKKDRMNRPRYTATLINSNITVDFPHLQKIMDSFNRREKMIISPSVYSIEGFNVYKMDSESINGYIDSWVNHLEEQIENT